MYISIIIKTFILYIFIVLAYRIMGKKEMGNLSIIDFIVSILIAEMAAMSIEEQERSILESIIPITELVLIEVILSLITLKSTKIRDICAEKLEQYNCYINFLDVIKTGRKLWIEVYFVPEKENINILNLRKVREEINVELKKEFDSLYVELIPDVDEESGSILDKVNTRRPDKITHLKKKEENKIRKKELIVR